MNEATSKNIEVRTKIPAQLWLWFEAVYLWDWGDPDLLAELIKHEQVPPEFRVALADIVAGARKRRNYKKSAVPAHIRFQLGRFSWELSAVRDAILSDKEEKVRVSEEMRIEPSEMIHRTRKAIRDRIESMAEEVGVSNELVKIIRRDFQSRIDRWPTV